MLIKEMNVHSTSVCQVRRSGLAPCRVLLKVYTEGSPSDNYIHLSRDQARRLAGELNRLADELFFDELRKEEAQNEQN